MARTSLARTGDFAEMKASAIAPRAGAVGSLLSRYSLNLGDTLLRHRAELAERASRVEAELANRVKSEFITNISHELRTPLNSILGFSKMLKEIENAPLNTEQVAEYAEFILGSAHNLLSVVNDIIMVSKLQSRKLELNIDELDVEEGLRICTSNAGEQAGAAGVRFVTSIAENLPLIWADAEQLRATVARIIDNAVRFTPEGGTVALTVKPVADGKVLICVSDTGIGMAPEDIGIALTEFGQINNRLDRDHEGTGLGLPIAKALTELQGAEFIIRSEKQKGTHVLLLFPSVQKAASQDAGGQTNAT